MDNTIKKKRNSHLETIKFGIKRAITAQSEWSDKVYDFNF